MKMNVMTFDEYNNQILLLIEALKFYGDENNYESKIKIDNGHIARNTLKNIEDIRILKEEMKNEYLVIDRDMDNLNKFIEKYKND